LIRTFLQRKRDDYPDAGRFEKNFNRTAESRKRNKGFTLTYLS
jgi:hypothetical protein